MACRVINVDLWWNFAIEQQAFCRVFRIGQEEETEIARFVVKDTVDTKLTAMQVTKSEIVSTAMGDQMRPNQLPLKVLLRLFGPMNDNDQEREFILVDDENDYDEGAPPLQADEEEAMAAGRQAKGPNRR
ncbi:MAG: hypothetical protein M1820_001016 [Bogoriella megaspora]|nr:MAG: hypothetical protein M1820_001016 [Bogoriella megaspora]